jgi:uncharacterized membrane protein YbhN (UPF0104 family)
METYRGLSRPRNQLLGRLKSLAPLIKVLKMLVPLGIGVYLIWWNYDALSEQERSELFHAFGSAELIWLFFSVVLGWLSHMSRAYRWRFLLEPLGQHPTFWNSYHATMIGYFVNMLIPRAGEASRAVFLQRYEGVPFHNGFGTILAERAVDLIMLGSIALLTIGLQLDKLDVIKAKFDLFQASRGPVDDAGFPWFSLILGIALIGGIVAFVLSKGLRKAIISFAIGVFDGIRTVWTTPKKVAFIGHTFLIWGLYVAMFAIGFLALPETSNIPLAGIMAGFIGGSIGIILVQGGVGIYPPLVAIMISLYMVDADPNELMTPAALAIGWLVWVAQTVMIIGLGGLSLLLMSRSKKFEHGTSSPTNR